MDKMVTIHLSGRNIPMEDTAYELLKKYLDNLSARYGHEEGGAEIISDIEDRIAEIFAEKLDQGIHRITDSDVNNMIGTIGYPDQFDDEKGSHHDENPPAGGNAAGSSGPGEKETEARPRKWMRNKQDKVLGGVCSGIADYFEIDPTIVRVIAIILLLAYGFGVLLYLILWIILPVGKNEPQKRPRRLYRSKDGKVIGGVASGLAAYFNIDVIIVRLIFLLPLLGVPFSGMQWQMMRFWDGQPMMHPVRAFALPSFFLIYIIFWIFTPQQPEPMETNKQDTVKPAPLREEENSLKKN